MTTLLRSASRSSGKERDSGTGNDYFDARYYGSTMGRFMSPDPVGGHTEDPQTLNRYNYVRNNPLNLTDPTGLDFYLSCEKQSDTCQKDKAGNLVQGQYVTDANGNKSFKETVVTSASLEDPNSGNSGTVNQNGVQITTASGTAQGIFINGTPEAHLQGSGDFEGFVFSVNKSDEKTGVWADGRYTYTGSRDQADVIKALSGIKGEFTYPGEGSLYNNHPGYFNFRFSSGAGCPTHDCLDGKSKKRMWVPGAPPLVVWIEIENECGCPTLRGFRRVGIRNLRSLAERSWAVPRTQKFENRLLGPTNLFFPN